MTLHIRQPLPGTDVQSLVSSAFSKPEPTGAYRNFFKRGLDVLLVLMAALPVLLVLAVCAILVARDGGSPFYSQTRVGRFGKTFKMWKLRTMVVDADEALERHLNEDPSARVEWNHHQKLRNDPRITKIGVVLRKTSLDELPQLWNVLIGDMSLVGPRPMMLDQQPLYPGSAYYALRPGLTGFWQISARNESGFAERAQYDADYLSKVSFAQDVSVMWKTVGVVTNGTGC